jgi:hypothetical protein
MDHDSSKNNNPDRRPTPCTVKPNLSIILTCDTDPLVGQNGLTESNKDEIWSETIESVTRLKERLDRHHDTATHTPRFSWFLRSDWEMQYTCGDWCYPARQYQSLWKTFEKSGDEIGWHPHLARREDMAGTWFQEIHDEDWIRICLEEGYGQLSTLFCIESCRAGWTYHSNFTMQLVSKMQVRFDLSALPGMNNHAGTAGLYDWTTSPRYPYHPSRMDYRRAEENSDSLKILEIPLTVYPVSFPLSLILRQNQKAINLSCRPFIFSHGLHHIFRDPAPEKKCIMYFHPSDVIHKKGINSQENCDENLEKLLISAKAKGMEIRFLTAGEFGRSWIQQEFQLNQR